MIMIDTRSRQSVEGLVDQSLQFEVLYVAEIEKKRQQYTGKTFRST